MRPLVLSGSRAKVVIRLGVLMRALLLITTVIIACAGSAKAQNFQFIGRSTTEVIGIDVESVRSVGPNRLGWIVVVLGEDANRSHDFIVMRIEMDCQGERQKILAFSGYKMSGETAFTSDSQTAWTMNFPGSNAETVHQSMCGLLPSPIGAFKTPQSFAQRVRMLWNELR